MGRSSMDRAQVPLSTTRRAIPPKAQHGQCGQQDHVDPQRSSFFVRARRGGDVGLHLVRFYRDCQISVIFSSLSTE
jgi:hypothetical protein